MKRVLKLLGTVILLYIVFRFVNGKQVIETLSRADVLFLFLALVFQVTSTLTAAIRWSLVMSGLEFHESFPFYIQSYFKGAFFNQALPGSIGGDAVKILEVSQRGYAKSDSFFGIAIDRLWGILGLILLNLTAILAAPKLLPPWLTHLIVTISLVGLSGFSGLIIFRQSALLKRLPGSSLFLGFSKRLKQLCGNLRLAASQVFLSILVHLFSVLAIFFLARAVGLPYSPLLFMVVVPPVLLLSYMPISLAGWGVREGAMVGVFLLIGGAKAPILSVSILYGLLLIVASLPGLLFWAESPEPLY